MNAQLAVVIPVLILVGCMIYVDLVCLRDIASAPAVRNLTRQQWAIICLVTFPVGPMLYWTYGKMR